MKFARILFFDKYKSGGPKAARNKFLFDYA